MVPGYAAWSAKMGLPYHSRVIQGNSGVLVDDECDRRQRITPPDLASGGLVAVVLLCSRLLEPLLSRDRLSAIQPCLLLSLAYGSSPKMLIVDLTHLVSHEMVVLLRLWLACSTGFTTSHLRHC